MCARLRMRFILQQAPELLGNGFIRLGRLTKTGWQDSGCFTQEQNLSVPKNTHNEAAQHYENAAKSHRKAAGQHEKGDHDSALQHSETAQGYSNQAQLASNQAHEKSKQHAADREAEGTKRATG